MQTIIEISGKNRSLFDGRVGTPTDALHINVQGQVGVDMVFRNTLKIIKKIPQHQRNEVLIRGVAPRWVALTVIAAVLPYFKRVMHFDGKDTVEIPRLESPPSDLPRCNEDEG